MDWHKKTFVTWCLILVLVMLPFTSLAESSDAYADEVKSGPEAMTIDIVLVRPLGLVATVLGSAVFLISSPFAAMGGNTQETWNTLVAEPAKFTFQRPLGHFEGER